VRRGRACAVAAAACLLLGASASAATVTVTVENVRNGRGEVHVDLCDEAAFLTTNCAFDAAVPAHRGRVVVTVTDVPPGRYAAVAYHDANGNRDLDLNGLGMPMEPFGFSNDAPMLLGPPLFKDAAFNVADKDVAVLIRLKP
jgi:uncharacterized protein (DUF2141 family)